MTYIKYLSNKDRIEAKIIRYIKHKRHKNITKIYFEKELDNIKKYIKLLKEGFYKNKIYNKINLKPKISFIASVYNKYKYLNSFIFSIQNQNLEEFELIIVDDCSTDESVKKIQEFQKKDQRIKLLINKKNKGSLYTRYKGAMLAKGEYIIFVDSDDIVLKEGILNSYNYIRKKNIDMVEFNSVFEKNETNIYISRRYFKYTNIIYQPTLSYIFFYDKKRGVELNTALWDKLIKREVVSKSLNFIGKEFLNKKIIIENDVIILFSLLRNANSFQYIDELGYYYFFNHNDSITNTKYDSKKANQIIYSIFSNIEFLYEKTENTYLSKYYCLYKLKTGFKRYKTCFQYLKNFILVNKVLNQLLNSNYISRKNKLTIKKIKKAIKHKKFGL